MKSITHTLRHHLSVLLAAAMTLTSIPVPGVSALALSNGPWASLTPPRQVASLISSYAGKSGSGKSERPDVILIQDLHFNYSVQRNIAKLLEFLGKKGVVGSRIAVEGAVGEVDNSLLTDVKNLKVREELADFLMQNGELTGSQYYSVMSGQPKLLQGVEDPDFFQANRDVFRKSFDPRQEATLLLSRIQARLETLVPSVCAQPVLRLRRASQRYEAGQMSMDAYWRRLSSMGRRAGVSLPVALEEYLQGTPERRSELLLSSHLHQAISDYSLAVQAAVAKTPLEKNLVGLLYEFELAERALKQHANLDEIRHVVSRMDQTVSLLELLSSDLKVDLRLDVERFKEALRASVDFYVGALMRNQPMLENTLALLSHEGREKRDEGSRARGETKVFSARPSSDLVSRPPSPVPVVLVVGGFHTDYFRRELTQRGISFAVYTPQIDAHTPADDRLYVERLLEKRLTASAAVKWIVRRGGIRGSPVAAEGLGLIPRLAELKWLPELKSISEKFGSLYPGGSIKGGSSANRQVAELDRLHRTYSIPDLISVPVRSIDDLGHHAFEDGSIPGGTEWRAVISVIFHAIELSQGDPNLRLELPIKGFQFTKSDVIHTELGDSVAEELIRSPEGLLYMRSIPVIHSPSSEFQLLIHNKALELDPRFVANPFKHLLVIVLHEMAEFSSGGGASHDALNVAGLADSYDPNMSIYEILSRFSAFLPGLKEYLLQRHDLRGDLEFYDQAFAYIRHQKTLGRSVTLDQLTGQDIANLTSFAFRNGLEPGEHFTVVTAGQFANKTLVRDATMTKREKLEAATVQLQGRVPRLIFAGGDAKRMRDDLVDMGWKGTLNDDALEAMWFLPLKKLLGHGNESMHWGARQMLHLNQSVRHLARAYNVGISEEQALANQRIILSLNDRSYMKIIKDFVSHDFYGFNPNHIYFMPSPTYRVRRIDKRTKTLVEAEDIQSVYGNGVPVELLIQPGMAKRVRKAGDHYRVETVAASPLRDLHSSLRSKYPGQRVILEMSRVNNLMNLRLEVLDMDRLAYAIKHMKAGRSLLVEMVVNPPLQLSRIDESYRKDELSPKAFAKELKERPIDQAIKRKMKGSDVASEPEMRDLFNSVLEDPSFASDPTLWDGLEIPANIRDLVDEAHEQNGLNPQEASAFRRMLLQSAYPLTTEAAVQKGGVVLEVKSTKDWVMPDNLSLADTRTAELIKASHDEALRSGSAPLVNLMAGAVDVEKLLEVLESAGMPISFEPGYPKNGKNMNAPPDHLIDQLVTGELTLYSRQFKPFYFVVVGPDQKIISLEDLKRIAHSQLLNAQIRISVADSDPSYLMLAAVTDFDISEHISDKPDTKQKTIAMLDDLADRSRTPELKVKAVTKAALLKADKSTAVEKEPVVVEIPNGGALRPTEVHWFAGIASVGLALGSLIHLPAMIFGLVAVFAVAAAGQELAVLSRAVVTRDASVLRTQQPLAWYDFDTETEDVESIPAAARVFAHAHEMGRALTRSRGAVAPRMVAPLTLPLALVDYTLASILHGINSMLSKFRGDPTPVPDSDMFKKMRLELPKIEMHLAPARQALAPRASGAWRNAWSGVQTRAGAVWKNSNARKEAAELAARQALSAAA